MPKKKNKAKNKKPVKARKVLTAKKPAKKKRPVAKAVKKIAIQAPDALFKARIKVLGIGGGGGSIVSEMGKNLQKATFVVADTDIRALKKKSGMKYFWFGDEFTHGLGTGVNVDLARQAAESARQKIGQHFKDQDIIIFVASLGGGLGSGATQIFADVAKEFGGITFGIFTMPFKFEGKNKYRIAQNALKQLRHSLNVSLVIPNEKIFKIIDETTPIVNAFSMVNKSLISSLESLIDLIYNPGIINIDFADLRAILRGVGNSAFLNTIEESGKDRVEKICQNIFKNPLLQTASFGAEKILFNIVGSDNLSMFEVEKISSHIASMNPKAKIIFGISKDQKLKNRIKTTILMTGGQMEEKPSEIIKEEPKAEAVAEKIKEKKQKAQKKTAKIIKKPLPKKKTAKKPKAKVGKKEKPQNKKEEFVQEAPVFAKPEISIPVFDQRRLEVVNADDLAKKTIRRSGLEIKEAEEMQEKKKIAQEKEWEIPAFLRKVKFNK